MKANPILSWLHERERNRINCPMMHVIDGEHIMSYYSTMLLYKTKLPNLKMKTSATDPSTGRASIANVL